LLVLSLTGFDPKRPFDRLDIFPKGSTL
jgi:hypothetical protein